MKDLIIGIGFLLLTASIMVASVYAQDVTVFVDGVEVDVPENRRVVTVPAHWTDEEIYREAHRAEGVEKLLPGPPPNCSDMDDDLVIGGAICIPD